MRKFIQNIFVILILSFILINDVSAVFADDDVQVFASETLAVSLVIDTSGSMSETDAENLRRAAANLFVDLLSSDDYIGVITFNTEATEVVSMQQVGNTSNRTTIKNKCSSLTEAEGDTNYTVALNAAASQLSEVDDDNVNKVIIFITDGAPDPDSSRSDDQEYMTNYMNNLWKSVDKLAQKDYPVYAIGFSDGIRTDVLSQIADETDGSFKILSDSSALASSVFEVLGELKNRISFLDETTDLSEDYEFEIPLNENTTQSTIVIVNQDDASYKIEIRDSSGNLMNSEASINKTSGYTVIRVNNDAEDSDETWTVQLTGSGTVEILGDRDMTLKSWILSPESSTGYEYNDEVDIKVKVTGEIQSGVTVNAIIENPDGEKQKISLNEDDNGIYLGTYDGTKLYGEYSVKINVLVNGEVVTSKTETFTVGILPIIKSSVYINSDGYRVGEQIPVAVWLTYEGNRLVTGSNLQVDSFIIRLTNEEGTVTDMDLSDYSEGIWSGAIDLTEATTSEIELVISGIFKGNRFELEESLGSYTVKEAGNVYVSCSKDHVFARSGKTVSIPLTLYNDSEFEEIIKISTESEFIDTISSQIVLEPGETKEVTLELSSEKGTELGNYDVDLVFEADNTETTFEQENDITVEVVSGSTYINSQIRAFFTSIIDVLGETASLIIVLIIIIVVLFILIGRIIFKHIKRSMSKLRGYLEYWKVGTDSKNSQTIQFDRVMKDSITVSFSDKNTNADYQIKGTRFNYDLVFSMFYDKSHLTITDGWRYLIKKTVPFKNMVVVTPPGIIEKEGQIYSTLFLKDEEFISGGYVFRFHHTKKTNGFRKRKGSNILEEKDEDRKSI